MITRYRVPHSAHAKSVVIVKGALKMLLNYLTSVVMVKLLIKMSSTMNLHQNQNIWA